MTSIEDIRNGAVRLGLSGRPVCLHASLRTFGRVVGGPRAVIDGLLDQGCTVMVPTFTDEFETSPPPGDRPARNGMDYDDLSSFAGDRDAVYSTETNEISADMGIIPKTLLEMPGRVRADHPIDSFSAVGPLAGELITVQTPEDVYGPFRVLADLDGFVLLAGVDLNRMTLIHYAEQLAGRELLVRWANGPDGRPITCRCGSCSEGFPNLNPYVGQLAHETVVGSSPWRAFPVQPFLEVAADVIRREPELTHCDDPECERCPDIVAGGPILND